MNTGKKLVIIGWDGATWERLDSLMGQGYLPNLQMWLNEPTTQRQNLVSTLPFLTVPAWTTFASGQNPGQYGIYGFLKPSGEFGQASPITAADFTISTFYQQLERKNIKSCLLNLPVPWPYGLEEGTGVASFLSGRSDYFFPEDLEKVAPLIKRYHGQPGLLVSRFGSLRQFAQSWRCVEKERFNLAQQLFQNVDWDLFFVLFSGSDALSHRAYGSAAGSAGRLAIASLFADLDKYLGWFVKQGFPLLFMSDHGFSTYRGTFYLNRWLWESGLLRLTAGAVLQTLGEHSLVGKSSWKWKLLSAVQGGAGQAVLSKIAGAAGSFVKHPLLLQLSGLGQRPDPAHSRAYGWPAACGLIYLNRGQLKDSAEELRKHMKSELLALRSSDGKCLVKNVFFPQEIYHGKFIHLAPDLILEPGDYYFNSTLSSGPFLDQATVFGHARSGILAGEQAIGLSGVKEIGGLAAVISGYFGIPSRPSFGDQKQPRPPSALSSDSVSQNQVTARLRALGYLD